VAVRRPVRCLGVDLAVGESRNVWKLSVFERSCSFASCWSLAIFPVGCNVEVDEEDEVGGDGNDASESGEFFTRALAGIGHPGPVCRGEVCVGCEVDEAWRKDRRLESEVYGQNDEKDWVHTNINNKLNNLKTSDPFLPPNSDAPRALEIVPVHENVNHEIESNHDP
jgi:hypothetical protein